MAIDILDELKKGNVSIFTKMTTNDKKYTITNLVESSSNKKEILNKILPILRNNGTYYGLAYEIFSIIYLDNDFKEDVFYLLHNQYVLLEELSEEEIKNILEKTKWGLEYILDNIETLRDKNDITRTVKELVDYSKNDINLYHAIKDKLLVVSKQHLRDDFIISSISSHVELTENDILSSLYQNPDDYYYKQETLPFYQEETKLIKSHIPCFLKFHALKNENLKKMMLENFKIFFETESDSKMRLFDFFINELDENIKNKYHDIYELYCEQPTLLIDKFISIMLNNNLSDWLNSFIKDKNFSYLTSGSTTSVFKVDNSVLKLSLEKYELDINKNLFLIAPTETKIIYKSERPILIIEVQKHLERTHNNQEMKKEDIDNFLKGLDELGYEVRDPRCLNKSFCNFGFLEDYHDANLGEFSSHDDLPDWFKERPIVLYDVDLVYRKDDPHKKTFRL